MFNVPTLVIDKQKVKANINRMREKAKANSLLLRPHFKTHQSAFIGELFREAGIDQIAVSSVTMANYFANHGWKDITIAFPVNLREIDEIKRLAGRVRLNLLLDSAYSTNYLVKNLDEKVGIYIEIDNGYNRSGLLPQQTAEMDRIASILEKAENLYFKGFLTHAGNTYSAKGTAEILAILNDSAAKLDSLKHRYRERFPKIMTSFGDTPSCSVVNNLQMFDEIRPGNFVYYDVMQYHIGSCTLNDIAVATACPVVSVYPHRKEMVIYGGAVHLSKEYIAAENGFQLFGYIVDIHENGWGEPIAGAYVSSISQEHGIIKIPEEYINRYKPGDVIGVLPVHSCLTADLLKDNSVVI